MPIMLQKARTRPTIRPETIKAAAHHQMTEHGTAGLTLRGIARGSVSPPRRSTTTSPILTT